MDTTLILQNIAKHHVQLTADEQAFFASLLKPKSVRRKQLLLQEGEVSKHSIFVNKGCLRGYTLDKNGFEHVLGFAPPDWWMSDMYSLITQKPGNLYIEALEDSEVLLLSRTGQEQLFGQVPKFERFFRILMENALVTNQQRLLDNLSLPAQERYRNFCQRYPSLVACLPKKQIASYIGVTPEFFSKMMTGMLRGKN